MKIKKKIIVLFFILAFFISILIIYFSNNIDILNKLLGKQSKQAEIEKSVEYKIYRYTNNEGKILIQFQDNENGIEKIKYPNDSNELICNGKDVVAIEYPIEKDKNYEFKMYTTTGKEIISNITINDEFLYENGINYKEEKVGTGYRIIDLKYFQDMDTTYKHYYKIGENGEWKEYKDSLLLIDYDVVKDNLINTEDNTVTLYAKSINNTKQEVILSKKYDVDINSKGAEIYTVEDLKNIEKNMAGSYRMMNDIDLYGIDWRPIGVDNKSVSFTGSFDGNGYVIRNLTVKAQSSCEGGLFCKLINATIKNLGIENVNISGGQQNAPLAYHADGTTTVSQVYATGQVTTSAGGGIIYSVSGGKFKISNSYSEVNCERPGSGGIIASSSASPNYTENCYSIGFIGYDWIYKGGGITNARGTTIATNCYYNKDITTQSVEYAGVTGCTTEQMKNQSTYEGWDFDNVWYMDQESGYPKLKVFKKD